MLSRGRKVRWLIDRDLPQIEGQEPDTLPITQCKRDIVTEALRDDRWVVTRNRNFLESRTIPFDCPPIVILDGGLCTEEGLRRNLLHFEFRLQQDNKNRRPGGQRFLVDLDRSIYRIIPEGGLEELEGWKIPGGKAVPAWGASI